MQTYAAANLAELAQLGGQQQLSSLRRQLIFQRRESALRQPQLARLEEVNDAEALHRVERVKAQRTARGQVPVVREDTLQPASRLFDAHERLEQPTRHERPIGIAIVGEVADFRQELIHLRYPPGGGGRSMRSSDRWPLAAGRDEQAQRRATCGEVSR